MAVVGTSGSEGGKSLHVRDQKDLGKRNERRYACKHRAEERSIAETFCNPAKGPTKHNTSTVAGPFMRNTLLRKRAPGF